ncbi:MAG TPA: DUF5999 family protein [Streptosporangiaceae bacterium]|nr:DUF5999 family protein [Streptosporangiaceae bacterium]
MTGVPAARARAVRRHHPGKPSGPGGRHYGAASCSERRHVTCQHALPCPPPDAPDCAAGRVIACHPEQGWSLLCEAASASAGLRHPAVPTPAPRR